MGIDQAALLPSFAWASGIDEHSRNKERHKSVSVESRLAGAALLRSTVPLPLGVCVMAAARANWKGYLRLSLVSCPIALYPATSESEKVRFNQLNKNTGNRIRYSKVDAETGEEVDSEDIIKGYQVSKGQYIEITDEDLEAVAVEFNPDHRHRPVRPA